MLSGENMRLWLWAELSNADVQGPPSCETWQPRGDFAAGYRNVWSSSGYNLRWNVWAGILKQVIGDLYPELLEWTAGPWLYSLLQVISSKSRGCIVEYYFKIFLLFTIFGICRSSPFLSTLMLPIIAATICFWKTCVVSSSISTWINFTSNITHCQCASWPDCRLYSSWSCLSFSLFICVASFWTMQSFLKSRLFLLP